MIARLKDPRDLWLFLRVLSTLIILPRLIRRLSLPELLVRLDPGVSRGHGGETWLRKTVGFTDSLLRYSIFQRYGKCLLRSLLLFRFLRQQGWPVEIHFGVKKTDKVDAVGSSTEHSEIIGHSWLVMEGKPFLESNQAENYFTTYTFPANFDQTKV